MAQLSSSEDQVTTEETIDSPLVIKMQHINSINNMGWDTHTNQLTIKEDGYYFIMAVAQVGARETASNILRGGNIYIWFVLNEKEVPDSGAWTFASPSSRAKMIVEQQALHLRAGDVMMFKFSTSAPGMGLLTFPATQYWPESAGIELTIYKIG